MTNKAQKGCLVVHGLTGTPANMIHIAETLQASGYVVKAPLLAGHGVNLKTLGESTWQQWYESVLDAYQSLAREVDKIFFAGLSMGALLGLKLAADIGHSLKALVLLAPPFKLRPLFRWVVIPSVRYTPVRFFLKSTAKNFEKSVLDPEGRKIYRQNSLHRMPAPAVFECQDLQRHVAKQLPKITQSLLLIQGRQDHLADPHGLLEIRKKVSSNFVDIVLLDRSAHVVTMDYDREEVSKRVVEFFESFGNA